MRRGALQNPAPSRRSCYEKRAGASLNLVGAIAWRDSLVRIGVCRGGRSSRFDSRDVCLCRTNTFFFGLAGLVQFVTELVLRFLKFPDRLSHSLRQLW